MTSHHFDCIWFLKASWEVCLIFQTAGSRKGAPLKSQASIHLPCRLPNRGSERLCWLQVFSYLTPNLLPVFCYPQQPYGFTIDSTLAPISISGWPQRTQVYKLNVVSIWCGLETGLHRTIIPARKIRSTRWETGNCQLKSDSEGALEGQRTTEKLGKNTWRFQQGH